MIGSFSPPAFLTVLVTLAACTSAVIFRVCVPVVPPALAALVVEPALGLASLPRPIEGVPNGVFLGPNSLSIKGSENLRPVAGLADVLPVFFLSVFNRDGNLSAMGFSLAYNMRSLPTPLSGDYRSHDTCFEKARIMRQSRQIQFGPACANCVAINTFYPWLSDTSIKHFGGE